MAISIGVGWVAWLIRGPKVQTTITWTNGQLLIKGPVSPHQKQEIQDFFASRFADVPHLKVTDPGRITIDANPSKNSDPRYYFGC